jgi:hypothetical protein
MQPQLDAMQNAISVLMQKKQLDAANNKWNQRMAQMQVDRQQDTAAKMAKIKSESTAARIKYLQGMMKTAYEKGDQKGLRAFGEKLSNLGFTVPGQALPQKQGMSEAELTQRALKGDKLAQSVLARMSERKRSTAAAGADKIDVNVGDKSMTELGKEMSKALVSERKDVQGAVTSLENLKEAKSMLDSGMITGTGAEFLTNAGNLLASRLGFEAAEDPVANTQAFAATMGTQVGQIIKQFGSGTGLSDADREYAEKIVGGKITLNEKAIRKLIRINEKAFKNVIRRFNKKASQAMSRPGADSLPYDLRVDYEFDEKQKKEKPRFKITKVK